MNTHEDDIAKRAQDLVKRYATAHKAALSKVAHHLNLAKAAHAKGMASLAKCAGMMSGTAKSADAGAAFKKDAGGMAGHLSDAADHFNTASDHMDDMEAHLGKAMSAWGHDTAVSASTETGGEITLPSLADLTEGGAPWYNSAEPYGEKAAKFAKLAKTILGVDIGDVLEARKPAAAADTGTAKMLTVEQAQEMTKLAVDAAVSKAAVESLTKQVEILSRQPAERKGVQLFDFAKTPLPGLDGAGGADGKGKLAKLLDGVDVAKLNDPDQFNDAGAKMIANMIGDRLAGGADFGKSPIFDGTFHGAAGRGRAGNTASR